MSDQDRNHTQEDTIHESDPAPVGQIDPGIDPQMEAIFGRIGSGMTDLGSDPDARVAGAIAALPAEVQETARKYAEGRPLAERQAERSVAAPEDWAPVYDRMRQRRAEDWRESVPAEFARASVDLLKPDQHPDKIRDWWRSERSNLVLRSDKVGNGKTYAAYAVANRFHERVWCVAYQLSALVKDEIDRNSDNRMMRRAVQAELLILDDVGQESGVEWKREAARDVLHRLFSARNGTGKRTIITTNRDGAWLEGVPDPANGVRGGYGSAVFDRLLQNATVITFTGESMRENSRPDGGEGWPEW